MCVLAQLGNPTMHILLTFSGVISGSAIVLSIVSTIAVTRKQWRFRFDGCDSCNLPPGVAADKEIAFVPAACAAFCSPCCPCNCRCRRLLVSSLPTFPLQTDWLGAWLCNAYASNESRKKRGKADEWGRAEQPG